MTNTTTTTKKTYDPAAVAKAAAMNVVAITPQQEIAWTQTRTNFLLKCPAFSHVLYTMMTKVSGEHLAIFTTDVPIAATDGLSLFLNPEPFFKLTLNERVFVMAHEVAHAIFDHCGLLHAYTKRGKIKYADGTDLPYDGMLMNIATDLVINDMLIEAKIGAFKKDWLHDKSLATGDDSVIDAYRKCYKQAKKSKGGGATQPGNGQVRFDDHLQPGKSQGKDPGAAGQDRNAQEWKNAVAAGISSAKAQGKMPGGLERQLGNVLEPQVSWQEHIQTFFARKVGGGGYDWRRADRRFIVREEQMYAPARSGNGANVVVVGIDTSGSINDQTIQLFLAEVAGILSDVKPNRTILMWCDAKVQGVDEVEEPSDLTSLKAKGGGGTDMGKIIEEVDAMGLGTDVSACVILTDGLTPFPPHAPSYPVLWGSIYQTPDKYPFGEVVMIPKVKQ